MGPDTILQRQINESWIQDGRVSSQAFFPTQKDRGLLSTYRGDLISAENAWYQFNNDPRCTSIGVMGVQVRECSDIGLASRPDPEEFPEHAVVDFSTCGVKESRRKAQVLRGVAETRGWLFRQPSSS